ncbi:MAG: hypothetical protein CMJ19_15930 [Phycisphaeraceae bacterium]|nr:hypothetical protein [Phycisphaeraceae bacterium]
MPATATAPAATAPAAAAKRGWGAIAGADRTKDLAPAPVRAGGAGGGGDTGPSTVITIDELDLGKLSVGKELQEGRNGDKFLELLYDGKRLVIAPCKLPDYVRCPFAAGPPKGSTDPDASYSIVCEITVAQFDKWTALENWLIENTKQFRDKAWGAPAARAGKAPKGMTEDEYENKFKSIVRPANVEMGYKPNMRFFVEHKAMNSKTGKPNRLPRILKTHLKGGGITKPIAGTVGDLTDNCAIAPVAGLNRGIYFTSVGWGMKFRLEEGYVLTNLGGTTGPTVDTSGVTILDEETPEEEATRFTGAPALTYSDNKRQRADGDIVPFPQMLGQFDDGSNGQQAMEQLLDGDD